MTSVSNQEESDEAFARRLQAQEMGIPDSQTPLMIRGNNQNPPVINTRLNEISSARATVCAILTVNIPQILAAIIVLSLHWEDDHVCDESHTLKWKWWAASSAFRMFAYSFIVSGMHLFKTWLDDRPRLLAQAISIRNIIDALGLIWFVVGNMWLFGDDENSCKHPERSPVYSLCISMLIINYIQICLPCIIAVILIPIFCFCMPCLIRILARLQNPRLNAGASDDTIRTLPTKVIGDDDMRLLGDDNTCAICLQEFSVGQEGRLLNCKHLFHKECVDEWLRVNATCPTCRKGVFSQPNNEEGKTTGLIEMSGGSSSSSTTGGRRILSRMSHASNVVGVGGGGGGASSTVRNPISR